MGNLLWVFSIVFWFNGYADLRRSLDKIRAKREKITTVLLLCFALTGLAQEQHSADDGHDHNTHNNQTQSADNHKGIVPFSFSKNKQLVDSILKVNVAPKKHADKFGRVVIQDLDGRMMPLNTYASEFLRKLSKSDTYDYGIMSL